MKPAPGSDAVVSARLLRVSDTVLLALGSLCALVFVYAALHYRSHFSGAGRIALYYAAPALSAASLFGSLRLRPERRVLVALLGSISLASLALLELAAGWQQHQGIDRAARRLGFEVDSRSMLEVVRDLNAEGVRAVASIFPAELIRRDREDGRGAAPAAHALLPLAGVARRPTVLCNEIGPYVIYESDEHGFNNPPGMWQGPVEVAALGDSFVHGRCVRPEHTAAARIRERHPRTLNLGMTGNGPLLELATLREFGPALRPAIVLWFYYEGNDLTMDLFAERQHPMLQRYLEDPGFSQDLRSRQAESDAELVRILDSAGAQAAAGSKSAGARLASFVRLEALRGALGLAFGRADLDLALFERVISEARRSVDAWGGQLVLVYLPSGLPRKVEERACVLAAAGRVGVPVVDVEPWFRGDPLRYFAGTGHYTEEGYRAVAAAVLAYLPTRSSGD